MPTQLKAKEREKDFKASQTVEQEDGKIVVTVCVVSEGEKDSKTRKIHLPEEREHSDKQLIYIQLRFSAKEGEAMDNKHRKICQQEFWNQIG